MNKGIGIAGIGGRMGRLLAEEVAAAREKLVGGIERPGVATPAGTTLFDDIAALARACDVVLEFTHASTAIPHASAIAESGTGWVLGTTGLSAADEAAVAEAAKRAPIVFAANFSPGVNLVLALAEQMGRAWPRPSSTTPKSWRCTTARRWMRPRAPRSPWAARWRRGAAHASMI